MSATAQADPHAHVTRRPKAKGLSGRVQTPASLAIRTALAGLTLGDMPFTLRTAKHAGRAFARSNLNRKRFQRALDNLEVAFPDQTPDWRRQHAERAYEHLFQLAVETAYAPRRLTEDAWSTHVRVAGVHPGLEHVLRGKPVVFLTGHCGSWELLGYTIALLGIPISALYRPLDLQPLDAWVRRTRQRRGLGLVDKFGAGEQLPKLFNAGTPIGFVADQNGGDKGEFVPFFGRMASAYKTVGLLAMKFEAPICCGMARRLVNWRTADDRECEPLSELLSPAAAADGPAWARAEAGIRSDVGFGAWAGEPFRYRIEMVDHITPDDWADQPDPLFYITARYRKAIETMVRRAPEQYLWMHRYWKSRPRYERLDRPMPARTRAKLEQLPWMTQDELDRVLDWTEQDRARLRTG